MRFASLLFIGLLICSGCAQVSEGDRKVMEQTYHIGNFVSQNAADNVVKQAGIDAALNSKTLMENLGAPSEPAGQYTPDLSKQSREQSKKEHTSGSGFLGILGKVATWSGLPWATAGVALLTAGISFVTKQIQSKKLQAVYSGVQNVVNGLRGVKGSNGIDVTSLIVNTMRTTATAHNVYKSIKKDLVALRKKGLLKDS